MKLSRFYQLEGVTLEIPLHYDPLSHIYIEDYPDLIQNPVFTPAGCPIFFTGEDACPYAQARDGEECIDCGSCRYYHQPPDILLGVCRHPKKRRGAGDGPDQADS